jgi:hypothetical protein
VVLHQSARVGVSASRGATWPKHSIRLHLVPVDRIREEEMLDLFGDLDLSAPPPAATRCHPLPPAATRSASSSRAPRPAHLDWGQHAPPLLHELPKHAVRPALFDLSEPPKDRELVVRHAHLYFVGLDGVVRSDRDEFGRWNGVEETASGLGRLEEKHDSTLPIPIGRSGGELDAGYPNPELHTSVGLACQTRSRPRR